MKKILISSILLFLAGCKENSTGMDKELFNSSYDKCRDYLSSALKSPSSLKINEVNVFTFMASPQNVSNVFGDMIIENGKIKESVKNDKVRFRELKLEIDYEAKNTYGVLLRGAYQCNFLYELNKEETSPHPLNTYLIGLNNDEEDRELNTHVPFSKFSGSNTFLDNSITRILGAKDSQFTPLDTKMYKEIEDKYEQQARDKEAERLRKSWNMSN